MFQVKQAFYTVRQDLNDILKFTLLLYTNLASDIPPIYKIVCGGRFATTAVVIMILLHSRG
nr:MAG TPA: hypothetical protein [Caudoviricetes sp.]